jgi:hypothetical protein
MNEINEIRDYCNNILREISFTYSSVQYKFETDFTFKTTEKEKKIKEDKKVKAKEIGAETLGVEEENVVLSKK